MARARKPQARASRPARTAMRSNTSARAAARTTVRSEHAGARRDDRGEANFRATIDSLVSEILASRRPWPLKKARRIFERAYVQFAIRRAGADRHDAATLLDIGFSTLKEKIRPR
jgi:DNA-binding NtrC family response regulator